MSEICFYFVVIKIFERFLNINIKINSMNWLQKLFNVKFLVEMAEFDRNSEDAKLNTMFYSSDYIISEMEKDIEKGTGIITPVEFAVYKGKGLLFEGCHRTAAAKNKGLESIPVKVILKGRLLGALKKRENKFKNL